MNGSAPQRRARPLLGTLVEIGVDTGEGRRDGAARDAIEAAFGRIAAVQACLSRFDATSDVARFNAMPAGGSLAMRPPTQAVLAAAAALGEASGGVFDVTLGSAPAGWRCDGARLTKIDGATRIDLGGIGKGYAVDSAVEALLERGIGAGWVNAGGDLRVFGDLKLPVWLRDEAHGGARRFASLADGAFATSCFGPGRASSLAGHAGRYVHASVAAPICLWADALTKVVAATGEVDDALLRRFDATAWIHGDAPDASLPSGRH